jgi:poly-gamma-glutamate capsule biosynthesis protein CapA/YwtB (metallophosphatase superfamily)
LDSNQSSVARHFNSTVKSALILAFIVPALLANAAEPLRIAFTGQALIQHDLRSTAPKKSTPLAEALDGHDVVFTDLETVIDAGQGAKTRDSAFYHAASPDVLDCLKAWHFNLLALSNNHSFDLGAKGIAATIEQVRQRGFVFAGTGGTLEAAAAPAVITTPRGKVALVSFASGKIGDGAAATATRAGINEVKLDEKTGEIDAADAARVFAALRNAAGVADVVIAYQHDHYWEKDNRITPAWKKRFAHACIEAGATVFVSHGAPLLHGIEIYRGRAIFYDLGGLVFHTITAPGYYLPEVWESALVEAEFQNGQLTALRLRAVALNEKGEGAPPAPRFYATRGAPTLATGAPARATLERVQKLSAALGTKISIDGDRAVVDLSTLSTP